MMEYVVFQLHINYIKHIQLHIFNYIQKTYIKCIFFSTKQIFEINLLKNEQQVPDK